MTNHHKNFVIFGGTGSLGKEIVKYLIEESKIAQPKEITVVSRDEQKHYAFRMSSLGVNCNNVVHDIRDADSLYDIIKNKDVVINCAAMKHISMCESDCWEAIKTNVHGVYNILKAVQQCERPSVFVNISTDKAPEATTLYGATKFLGEGLIRNFADNDFNHMYYSVRYGNVIMSKGAAFNKFVELAKNNQAIYVTDERMTRFAMLFSEAVELIMLAAIYKAAPSGSIFIPQKLPSFKVMDLAHVIVEELNSDSPVYVGSGISKGEKIHEVLLSQTECYDSNVKSLNYVSKSINHIPMAYVYTQHFEHRDSNVIEYRSDNEKFLMSKEQLREYIRNAKLLDA